MFKKSKSKSIRRVRERESDSSDEEQSSLISTLEETKELRKIRQKQSGISAETLLATKKSEQKTEKDDDSHRINAGGMVDLLAAKNAPKLDDAYDTGIGTSFSAETNRRDEDAEMQKFIEENLAKRKGVQKDDETQAARPKYMTPEEAALLSVPDYLRNSTAHKSEEMLSNQMLNGIPEVDLGLDIKIKNIEATEEAKQRLIRESFRSKEKPSEFVPKNMAANFMQHNRFNINDHGSHDKKKDKKPKSKVEAVVGGGVKISTHAPKRTSTDNATDDMHYEKFRKQFRRH